MKTNRLLGVLAITSLAFQLGGCKRDEPLPEIPLSQADGALEVVDAADPEGGSVGTFAVSDMTRPPDSGDVGWWPSMAIAPDGTPHLTYTDAYNGALVHAERTDGEWLLTAVDSHGAVGKYPALAIDDSGNPHVIYYNQDSQILRHAMRVESGEVDLSDRRRPRGAHEEWSFEIVDQGSEIGMAGRLLVGKGGVLHAVYYGPDERLIHARRSPPEDEERGRWQRTIIDRDAAGSHSIVIGLAQGEDGTLHLSYSNWRVSSSELRYGRKAPDAEEWEVGKLEGTDDAGWKSGLLLDEQDRPVVAYLVLQSRRIWIARLEDDEWKHSPLVDKANTMDLVGVAGGPLVLAYEHLPGRGLSGAEVRYLWREDALGDLKEGWKAFEIPGGSMSTYLSLAITDEGEPMAAFYRGDIRGVSVFDGSGAIDAPSDDEPPAESASDDDAEEAADDGEESEENDSPEEADDGEAEPKKEEDGD